MWKVTPKAWFPDIPTFTKRVGADFSHVKRLALPSHSKKIKTLNALSAGAARAIL